MTQRIFIFVLLLIGNLLGGTSYASGVLSTSLEATQAKVVIDPQAPHHQSLPPLAEEWEIEEEEESSMGAKKRSPKTYLAAPTLDSFTCSRHDRLSEVRLGRHSLIQPPAVPHFLLFEQFLL